MSEIDTAGRPLPYLMTLAAVGFLSTTTGLMTVGLLPLIAADFSITESTAGLMTAVFAGAIAVGALPLVAATWRMKRRVLLSGALAVFVIANAVIAASPVFGVALAGRVLTGMAQGVIWAVLAPYAAALVAPAHVGRALAVVFSGNTLGMALGAPVGALLGTAMGWRSTFLLVSAAAATLALVVLTLPSIERPTEIAFSAKAAFRQPGMLSVTVVWPLLLIGNFSLLTYLAVFVLQTEAVHPADALALALFGSAGFAGVAIAGAVIDSRARSAIVLAITAWLVALTILVLGQSLVPLFAAVFVWGACAAACSVVNQHAMIRVAGAHRDTASTIIVVLTQAGIALGALYGGAALDAVGVQVLPLAAAAPVLLALPVVLISRRHAYPSRRR